MTGNVHVFTFRREEFGKASKQVAAFIAGEGAKMASEKEAEEFVRAFMLDRAAAGAPAGAGDRPAGFVAWADEHIGIGCAMNLATFVAAARGAFPTYARNPARLSRDLGQITGEQGPFKIFGRARPMICRVPPYARNRGEAA